MVSEFPTHWQLRTQSLALPQPGRSQRPLVMGIVNVTPDSFSDGGRHDSAEAAVRHGLQLVAEGADLLDVGGESTRPYATPVDEAEELRRVEQVVAALTERSGVPVSIDTSKAVVAERAVALGAEIINDVTGLEGDPRMLGVAVRSKAGVCCMHMQGTPQDMQIAPHYDDVVTEIHAYLAARRTALEAAGIASERICLDPGIGFGKTHEHNLTLIRRAGDFLNLGVPILVGHSRKGFIGKQIRTSMQIDSETLPADRDLLWRDGGTVGVACRLAETGVQIIRVHAVGLVRSALELFVR
ncbi:MAG: dihydropteroate synthase [Pirellulales bacterium]|jgi:dihydropteroate synthase